MNDRILLTIIAPSVQLSMDVAVAPIVSGDELCRVCARWIEEKSQKRYIAYSGSILLRKRTQSVFIGTQTLSVRNVENNEIFYLF